ncbi:MAG: hypothetical protein ACD_58C00151G0005 [uncultured bacterium]|nr:MAG: hypothetical protein ACD_58C00151G0005 [uncultured bacterium]
MNLQASNLKSYKLQATSYLGAFTLIELMVTISIMVMLLIVALPSFRTYSYTNELDRANETISSGIVEAQTLALASPTDKDVTHDSYKIEFTQNGYKIYSGLKFGEDFANNTNSQPKEIKSNTLPKNVVISNINLSANRLIYSIQDQGRISYPTSGTFELKLTHNKLSKSQTISVNLVTGQVSIR